jgi:hypothetical protein
MSKGNVAPAQPAAQAPWTNNNLACVYTWLDLNYINELNSTFDVSGDIPMNKLRFWNDAASAEARRIDAMAVAAQLAKMFTGVNFATYENGKNYAVAVEAMTNVLVVATKTVAELAVVVDDNYNFFGEIKTS